MNTCYGLNGLNQKWINYQATGNAFVGYEKYWLRGRSSWSQRPTHWTTPCLISNPLYPNKQCWGGISLQTAPLHLHHPWLLGVFWHHQAHPQCPDSFFRLGSHDPAVEVPVPIPALPFFHPISRNKWSGSSTETAGTEHLRAAIAYPIALPNCTQNR